VVGWNYGIDGPVRRDVIIEKHYRGITSRVSVEVFWEEVNKRTKRDVSRRRAHTRSRLLRMPSPSPPAPTQDVPPILVTAKYYLVNIYRNGLYFLATLATEVRDAARRTHIHARAPARAALSGHACKGGGVCACVDFWQHYPPPPPPPSRCLPQQDALGVVEFLHRLFDTFQEYFGEVSARSLTDNFSITYQLCEEMLDNGHPMITELNALTSLIAPPSIVGRMASFIVGKSSGVSETLGEGAMSIIPWRRSGVKYAQNEITFDIIEEVDAIYER